MPRDRTVAAALLALALVALLTTAPAAMAKEAPDWEDGFTFVWSWSALPEYDVHGSGLVWLSKTTTGVDIFLSDLGSGESGTPRLITSIPPPPTQTLSLNSLSFDGRWATWSDNRFGNLDVFALDTQTGHLTRLSEDPNDDTEAALDDGRVAWSSKGKLLVHDLRNGTTWQPDTGPGQARHPALAGDALAWIRIHGDRRHVVASDLAGREARDLGNDVGSYAHALSGEGDLLAWEARVLRVRDQPGSGFERTVVQAVRDVLGGGTVQNLTSVPDFQAGRGSPLALDVGGHRVAWLDPTERETDLRAVDLQSGDETTVASKARGLGISDLYAVAFAGEPGFGQFHSRPWDAAEGADGKDAAGPGLPALALAVAALAAVTRRRTR